jgi:hypothetical protein
VLIFQSHIQTINFIFNLITADPDSMKDKTNVIFLKSLLYVSLFHIYLYILQELFEVISVTVKRFGLVEVEFFGSVDWLSHGESLYNRLVVSLDGGKKVFKRGVRRIRSRFGEIARFN